VYHNGLNINRLLETDVWRFSRVHSMCLMMLVQVLRCFTADIQNLFYSPPAPRAALWVGYFQACKGAEL